MNQNRRYSDSELHHKLKLNYLPAFTYRYGLMGGMFLWLLNSLVRAASFSSQCVLRYGIGRASFGAMTILFSFLWVNFFVLGELRYTFSRDEHSQALEVNEKLIPLYSAWAYAKQFGRDVCLIDDAILEGPMDYGSKAAYFFSYIVLILGVFNILYEQFVEEKKKPNIDFRGESILLLWLRSKKVSLPFDLTVFQRLIEPALIAACGSILVLTGKAWNFGLMLILSAGALFLEELRAFNRERRYKDSWRRQGSTTI